MPTDPITAGLLAVTGARNPEAFGQAAAQAGISPQGGDGMAGFGFAGPGLGSLLAPGASGLPAGSNLGRFGPGTLPGGGAATAGAPGVGIEGALKGLQGFKGPEEVKPVFQGGIRGAQQAPGFNPAGLQGGQLLQALQAIIQPAQGVAPLGTFLGGR